MKEFKGIHYLGGNFMVESIYENFGVKVPEFPAKSLFIKIN
jgi:hypothetical protein